MVKRHKPEEIAGVLEFKGLREEDASFKAWVAEHKASNGGKIRVSLGATGVRVMFSKEADMATWKARHEAALKAAAKAAA